MPNLPLESASRPDDLRAYLESVLPGSIVTKAMTDSEYQPLVLLQTAHTMAAFAFSNGDLRKSYDALYGGFKKYYSKQKGQWDALDLAFVFCVRPEAPNLDRFCSNVETDVYFCRKFVIPLAPPIGEALARLPFLPLVPLHGHSFRPPSAQTFLQQCGVPATLAKYLVVQRERSPEGILEDCTNGILGEPRELTVAQSTPIEHEHRGGPPVRLESVVIKDFRAYRKQQTFAVGADVTVLYGPNGFGKTSFFDAVDFGITGEIGRIKSGSEPHFKKTAKHLDSKPEESVVSLSFISNGVVRNVTRRVNDRKQALLDGLKSDRKTILAELTGGDIPAADRVENFVSLFRATHLFSQEHQELAKDFQDDCRLSEPIVSRMLAFEDYANAVNKGSRVREIVQAAIASTNVEIKELSEQIADERKELNRLGQTAEGNANVAALDAEIASLQKKIAKIGIPVDSGESDVVTVRGWRASLEARHSESQSRIARLSVLAKEMASLPRIRTELASLREQLKKKEDALDEAERKRSTSEQNVKRVEQRLSDMIGKRAVAQTRAALLEWVRATKPGYEQMLAGQRDVTEQRKRATEILTQERLSEANASSAVRNHESLAAQVSERLASKRTELVAMEALNESIGTWEASRIQLASVVEEELIAQSSLELVRAEERELAPQVATLAAQEERLSSHIAEVDKSQSELKRLLSQLQGHVGSGICPLCGEDHGSKEELVRKIQQRSAADPASSARSELIVVQGQSEQLAERVANNKQKRRTVDAHLTSLKLEKERLSSAIARFVDSAAKHGIPAESSAKTPAEQIQIQLDSLQQDVTDLTRQAVDLDRELQSGRTKLAKAREMVMGREAEVTDKEAALAHLQEETNRLRKDPRLTQVSLDIEPEPLAELERLNLVDLNSFNAEAAKAESEATQLRTEMSARQQEADSLKAELPLVRSQIANLQRTVTQLTGRLEESKLPPDANEESVLALIAQESRAQTQFHALRDSAASIELAMDAATTAAALTRLLQNIRNKERALAAAVRKHDQYGPWLKYFDILVGLVSTQQSEAIASFAREYGPRTSVIQRRLRSVYGFDEIEIHSRESTISVRVKRHGEELRPTDYFSQSQQQTLLLGLFLTAYLSQTWSALSPVFLDDPVTHFDDLNTYAFLDLIVGLLESDFGERQFIISTCDEKLLQLARQKFRHLGDRAKFYRFSAISADGPVIDEVGLQ